MPFEHWLYELTISSAVAERPHDASCLSVVSFKSTKRRAQSFIVTYFFYHCVRLNALLLSWRNVETSCHTLCRCFPPSSNWAAYYQRSVTTVGPWTCGVVLITPGQLQRWHHAVKPDKNRDFCLPHLHSTPPLGEFPLIYCHAAWKKTRMSWFLATQRWKKCEDMFIRFVRMYERNRHTDTRTPYDS